MVKKHLLVPLAILFFSAASAQNIGIGTTSPAYRLDVRGSINTDSFYRIGGQRILQLRGGSNVFIGSGTGSVTSGGFNTITGNQAFAFNTTGNYNTGVGYGTLYNNTTGEGNTASGMSVLGFNLTGSYNTAFGFDAMYSNTTGARNTAIGSGALSGTHNSEFNTAVGTRAGYAHDIGWNNTIIGADADVSFDGQYNSIAIGNVAGCPDNSTVRIGNSANWSYGAYANWTNISDERFKRNVKENVAGLNFIMLLRPVTYQMNVTALSKKLNEGDGKELNETMKLAIAEKEKMVWTGFMAQEVETAAKATGFDFSGVDKPRNDYGVYGLRYAEFVVPLVKGMQEQQLLIESLQKRNEELAKRIEALEKLLVKQTGSP